MKLKMNNSNIIIFFGLILLLLIGIILYLIVSIDKSGRSTNNPRNIGLMHNKRVLIHLDNES